jgi:Anti-sigma-K factor rskA, C-terminal/Sigma-70, region 4
MASLDSLPPDQRAVLQLVLQRGRSYDEIARMLSIDRAAVRERALAAFDALGPGTRVPPERRALITDYLLGQLPQLVAEDTRRRLGDSAAERAWARVVASELGTLSNGPLPEIPVEPIEAEPEPEAPTSAVATAEPVPAAPAEPAPGPGEREATRPTRPPVTPPPSERRSSRRGGAVVLTIGGIIAVAAVVVAIILITNSGGSSKHTTTGANVPTTTATTGSATTGTNTNTTTTTSTTASATPLARVILTSPTGNKKLSGAAVVVAQSGKTGIVIRATGLPANTSHDAYAVWLYNSATDSHLLGFVNPGVKSDGVLQAGALLPPNTSHFKQLLITVETTAKPHQPGATILKGPLNVPA